MKEIKDIATNRILVWLMWLVPIGCTGWLSVIVWTIIQVYIYNSEIEKLKDFYKPMRERRDVKRMNDPKNLTNEEKEILKKDPRLIKIGEGTYMYEGK